MSSSILLLSQIEGLTSLQTKLSLLFAFLALQTNGHLLRGLGLRNNKKRRLFVSRASRKIEREREQSNLRVEECDNYVNLMCRVFNTVKKT